MPRNTPADGRGQGRYDRSTDSATPPSASPSSSLVRHPTDSEGQQVESGLARQLSEFARHLQAGDKDASIDTSAARAAAVAGLDDSVVVHHFQVEGGTYAGIEAQAWELNDAGLLEIDTGIAMPTAPGQPARVVDDDYGLRVTDAGRAALSDRRAT